jgi:hypothetical protein
MQGISEQESDRSANDGGNNNDDAALEGEGALDIYLTGITSNIGAIAAQAQAMSKALAELQSRLKDADSQGESGKPAKK